MPGQSFGVQVIPVRLSLKDSSEGAQWRRRKVSSRPWPMRISLRWKGKEVQATDPKNFIRCGVSRMPLASLDIIQPIRLKSPFVHEGPGDKVFVQEERVKNWLRVHAIVYIGSHFENVSFAWCWLKEFKR